MHCRIIVSCVLLEQLWFMGRVAVGGVGRVDGTRQPGNNKISQAKGQTVSLSHDRIIRGKRAALTSRDLNQSGRYKQNNLLASKSHSRASKLNCSRNRKSVEENADSLWPCDCLSDCCRSRGSWSCPSRWPCGRSRTCASGWRSTVPTSTRSTATPSNSTTSQVRWLRQLDPLAAGNIAQILIWCFCMTHTKMSGFLERVEGQYCETTNLSWVKPPWLCKFISLAWLAAGSLYLCLMIHTA